MMWSVWWVWLSAALVLGIAEVILPGFIFLGFALGAALTGLLLLTGVAPSAAWAFVIFALCSAMAYGGLRYGFGKGRSQVRRIDRDINDNP
jgi:inner membrane protein